MGLFKAKHKKTRLPAVRGVLLVVDVGLIALVPAASAPAPTVAPRYPPDAPARARQLRHALGRAPPALAPPGRQPQHRTHTHNTALTQTERHRVTNTTYIK